MNISNLPSVEDVQTIAIRLIFGQGFVVVLLLFVKKVYDWCRTGVDTVERVKKAANVTRGLTARARKMQSYVLVAAFFSLVAMLIAQAAWLAFNFFLGNLVADAVASKFPDNQIPAWSEIVGSLRWGVEPDVYVAASIAALIISYRVMGRSVEPSSVRVLGNIFSIPGIIYGACGILAGPLTLLVYLLGAHGNGVSVKWAITEFAVGVVGCMYAFTCKYILRAPWMVARSWSSAWSVEKTQAQ